MLGPTPPALEYHWNGIWTAARIYRKPFLIQWVVRSYFDGYNIFITQRTPRFHLHKLIARDCNNCFLIFYKHAGCCTDFMQMLSCFRLIFFLSCHESRQLSGWIFVVRCRNNTWAMVDHRNCSFAGVMDFVGELKKLNIINRCIFDKNVIFFSQFRIF